MRREPEFFGEAELDLIYMARSLRDALRLEKVLTEASVEYLVETGTYTAGFFLKRELTGAFFYITPQDAQRTREVLELNRYKAYAAD